MTKALRDMTEPELYSAMRAAAGAVARRFPRGTLFTLLVYDDPGVAQYITNGNREDVIKAMRETADRLERKEDIPRNPPEQPDPKPEAAK